MCRKEITGEIRSPAEEEMMVEGIKFSPHFADTE